MRSIRTATFLRRVILADAAVVFASGLLMTFGAEVLERAFGLPAALSRWTGVGLLPFSAVLWYLGKRESLPATIVWAVVALNLLWVADSALLLVTGWVAPTQAGYAFLVAQALAVAVFAALEVVGLRKSAAAATSFTALALCAALLTTQACAQTEDTTTAAPSSTNTTTTATTPNTTTAAETNTTTVGDAAQTDFARHFKGAPGTFVLYDMKRDRYLRHDAARARERFSPFSTFKIPNSLIGLETGVIRDAAFVIKWDEKKYPRQESFPAWWQDHTLRSAFRNSVVWYYRELAAGVGEERMRDLVTKFRYGNQDTSGGLTKFWLNSSLKISADEQVEFLKALYKEELPVSKRTYTIFKDIFVHEKGDGYKLSAKTGGGPLGERALGWFVGYLETRDNVYFFATQVEGPNYESIREPRINITKDILTDLGHLPKKSTED